MNKVEMYTSSGDLRNSRQRGTRGTPSMCISEAVRETNVPAHKIKAKLKETGLEPVFIVSRTNRKRRYYDRVKLLALCDDIKWERGES